MKKLYTILILAVLGFQPMTAQNEDTEKADEHFDQMEYVQAIEEYTELVEDGEANDYVYKRLAEANYNIYNTKEAERYYAMIQNSDIMTSEDLFRYAQMLKANQKFEESNQVMRRFAEMAPNDDRAEQFLENPNYIPQLLEAKEKFTVKRLDINTPHSDFGGFEKGNKFYFTSSRDGDNTFGLTGLDIYFAPIEGDQLGEVEEVPGEVNTKFNEGTIAITDDGKTMYFTRINYVDGDYESAEDGKSKLQLLSAELINGEWEDVKKLPFNENGFSTGHPALSPDGKILYFVSNRPGGFGGTDIYKVEINEDGTFGEPENLGRTINTAGKEFTPYVGSGGTLYFSSDGQLGLGGLDVFYAEPDGDGFKRPKNMGRPVNSVGDDLSFSINEETMEGYISSNRGTEDAEQPNDDIFKVKQLEPLCELELIASVTDANTNESLSGATVTLYDDQENQIASRTTDYNGEVTFQVGCDQEYVVQVNMDDYESESETVEETEENSVTVDIELNPIEEIIQEEEVVLNPIHFEFDKSNITAQAAFELDKLVEVMQKYPEMQIQVYGHTDNRGSDRYNQQLSERRAKSTVQYVISKGIDASRISGEGKGESEPAVDCAPNCTEEQHQMNRRSQFIIVED